MDGMAIYCSIMSFIETVKRRGKKSSRVLWNYMKGGQFFPDWPVFGLSLCATWLNCNFCHGKLCKKSGENIEI